ncbi:MAG TPA: 5-(carboxyamino)imidazole ribonucleotide mutase [Candidatus Krumholzibacteria bacterium]|nr:5-(carboxyamino)imidazole ribonucleotide mutase [Candidatus Krumholzibacteria bacterium]HRX51100.1 5-(carboxyamino)imidazole ribonucleotide mutase [Candidatus Krumholzibacteria bacterium]
MSVELKDARVVIVMGSDSDRPVVEPTGALLERFGIPYRVEVASAHRSPDRLRRIVQEGDAAQVQVWVGVAGLAAHLPGVLASLTLKPVIGVPVAAGALQGMDALLSIVQMPGGIPVAGVAIGSSGAKNAAVLAARILALSDADVAAKLAAHRQEMAGE